MLLRAILCTISITPQLCEVPENFRIRLERDRQDKLRIRSYFRPSGEQERFVRPWIKSHDCGDFDRFGEHTLAFEAFGNSTVQASVDITDMVLFVEGYHSVMGLCLNHRAALKRSVDSVIYMENSDGYEYLVLQPSSARDLSLFNEIAYVDVHYVEGYMYGYAVAASNDSSDIVQSDRRLYNVEIRLNDNSMSIIPTDVFAVIDRGISDLGGILRRHSEQLEILGLSNCYERLVDYLPPIEWFFLNSRNSEPTTKLVFRTRDYISRTPNPNICLLHVDGNPTDDILVLTDHLIVRIGCLHFDYFNHRIGFFDPI